MSTIQKGTQYQSSWSVSETKATPESLISFIQEIATRTEFGTPTAATLSLSGSILGITLTGEPNQVAKDFADIEDKQFNNATYKATFPLQSNMTITLAFSFPQRLLSVSLQSTSPAHAMLVTQVIQNHFPHEAGISQQEIADKATHIRKLVQDAEKVSSNAQAADQILTQIDGALKQGSEAAEKVKALQGETSTLKSQIAEAKISIETLLQEAKAHISEMGNLKAQIQADQKTVTQSQSNVGAMESKVKEFFGQVDSNSKKLTEHENQVSSLVKTATDKTNGIVAKNESLQAEIKEHLLKAVGASLFGAFQKRQVRIVVAKWIWASLSAISLLIQAVAVVWLAYEAKNLYTPENGLIISPVFLLKATVAIPILFLIIFCVRQYGHEREYEELYAFKAALSFSLSPYLDLVERLSKKEVTQAYRDFVVATIQQVFDDPLPKLQKESYKRAKDVGSAKDLVNSITELVGKVIK